MPSKRITKCSYDNGFIEELDKSISEAFEDSTSLADKTDALAQSRALQWKKKLRKIRDILTRFTNPIQHLHTVRKYAVESGLLYDEFRRELWPLLAHNLPSMEQQSIDDRYEAISVRSGYLSVPTEVTQDSRTCSESEVFDSARSSIDTEYDDAENDLLDVVSKNTPPLMEDLQKHVEWNQVELDVNRTLSRFPPNISETERLQLQGDLTPMIVELIASNASFKYYQGFHDVCLTLLLALDVERAKTVARNLVERGSFRNYLTKTLEESVLQELNLMYVILHLCDPELERHMRFAELGTLFALSWPITWFSHALYSYEQVARCFDVFLSSHPLMPIYVSAALVEYRRGEVTSAEPEMPTLHHLLNNVPQSIDLEEILKRAQELYVEFPPLLVKGKYLRQYEELCHAEGRFGRVIPANTLQRNNLMRNPLVAAGFVVVSYAMYWWFSNYRLEFSLT